MKDLPQSKPLTHSKLEAIRAERAGTMLLFLTDRCPVGCAHCSVDSRKDSPTISDFDLFGEVTTWIAQQENYDVVGISGGEPFVEKRGLLEATKKFASVGKSQVVFTSGVWATSANTSEWISTVLDRIDTVYLSTDGFHASQISDDVFMRAAKQITAAGCWLIVQFISDPKTEAHVHRLIQEALGDDFAQFAEFNQTSLLENGRGADIFTAPKKYLGSSLPSCHLARNPMIRYDGQFSACCNESVIMGMGPSALRHKAQSASEMDAVVTGFENDPLIRSIGGAGLGSLTMHPAFADLADQEFRNSCDLCWKLFDRVARTDAPNGKDPLLNAIATLEA